jgi:hypothetical protein
MTVIPIPSSATIPLHVEDALIVMSVAVMLVIIFGVGA